MDSEQEQRLLKVHQNPAQWLESGWIAIAVCLLSPMAIVLSDLFQRMSLDDNGIPGMVLTLVVYAVALPVLGASLLGLLALVRGHYRSRWIRAVMANNSDVFADLAFGIAEGRERGFWADGVQGPEMQWVSSRYTKILQEMLEDLNVVLPTCASVSEVDEVIRGIERDSQSFRGLRRIRNGTFCQEYPEKGFGLGF